MSTIGKSADAARKPVAPMSNSQKNSSTPNAWAKGTTNPVTGTVVSNGIANSSSKSKGPLVPPKDTVAPSTQPNDKLMFLLAHSTGFAATVTLKRGDRYSGIFSSSSPEALPTKYVLKMVRKLSSHGKKTSGVVEEQIGTGPDRSMSFEISDVLDLALENVRLDKIKSQNGVSSSFRTDTDISGGRSVRERELQRWDAPAGSPNVNLSLDSKNIGGWDQFETNKRITGVESSFNEDDYTTKINRDAKDYHERLARADKLARDIQGSGTGGNRHIAEERGLETPQDNGVDEEEKYSGVQRLADFQSLSSGQPNKYTPPARRPQGGQPAVPAAAADPTGKTPDAPTITRNKNTEGVGDAKVEDTTPAKKAELVEDTTNSQLDKPVSSASREIEVPSYARTSSKEGGATETVEKDVMTAFKHFRDMEKMRVQEHQRTVARRDKAVKLNDLKKFAENFKLNTIVPKDLVPILAKDPKKQQEIVEKAKKQVVDPPRKTPPRATPSAVASPTEQKTAKPTRPDVAQPSPMAPTKRPSQQQSSRPPNPNFPQAMRSAPGQQTPHRIAHGNLSQRLPQAVQQHQHQQRQGHGQGLSNMTPGHMFEARAPPTGPSDVSSGLPSPSGGGNKPWNAKAQTFTPNPNVASFMPGGSNPSTGSSPMRGEPANRVPAERKPPAQGNFFEGKGLPSTAQRPSVTSAFNPIPRMKKEAEASDKKWSLNGNFPPAYRTPPTWPVPKGNEEKKYEDMFEKAPNHVPQHPSNMSQQPYQHQLPSFAQSQSYSMQHGHTPQQTPRHLPVQPHHAGPITPHHYDDHRMQLSQSTSSIHPSPRVVQPYIAYNGQGPGPPGPFYPQGLPGFGMQTNGGGGHPMMSRQISGGPHFMPQGPVPGYFVAGQQPNGQFVQMNQPMMYSNMPMQAYTQHGVQPGANGFGSPRPPAPMMAQQGSQQGHPSNMMYVPQQPGPPSSHGPAMFGHPPQGHVTPIRGQYGQPHWQASPHFQYPQLQRGTPNGSYAQPMMPGPQGMAAGGAPMISDGGAPSET